MSCPGHPCRPATVAGGRGASNIGPVPRSGPSGTQPTDMQPAGSRPSTVRYRALPVMRILVAYEDPATCSRIASGLMESGHRVRVALDTPSAVAAARQFEPDVVLLTDSVADVTGYDVC